MLLLLTGTFWLECSAAENAVTGNDVLLCILYHIGMDLASVFSTVVIKRDLMVTVQRPELFH